MIQRIIPLIIGITLLLSGCAQQQEKQGAADFNAGATLLKVAHLPSPTADGSSLFITIDGKEAGPLPVGEAMLLQVPEGEHLVGGYARSLIGSVTIPALKVTTSPDSPRFVAYRVARNSPLFIERGVDPLPQSAPLPKKQVAQSEPVPVPQITEIAMPVSEPEAAVTDASAAPTTAENSPPVAQAATAEKPTSASSPVAPEAAKAATTPSAVLPETTPAPGVSSQPASAHAADALWVPGVTQKTEATKPTETPKPTDVPKSAEAPKQADAPKQTETPVAPAPAPQQKAPAVGTP